jgi:NAD(P)-dependent dehydrogenase (short-subunit alcohol dehydrogenase family)
VAGRTALVTGAGRGIGLQIARRLARDGHAVHLAARSEDEVVAAVATIAERGGRAFGHRCDVTSDEDVAAVVARIDDTSGPVEVLVGCAGAHVAGRFVDLDVQAFRDLFDVNVLGVVRAMHAVLPAMLDAGWGRIVSIASTAGKWGSLDQSPYNASKHALVGLTRCVALELATTGVTVNAVCPGFVDTTMLQDLLSRRATRLGVDREVSDAALLARVPMGRFLTADEIAGLVAYVVSDEAGGMTGQSITLDGGMVLS